MSDRTVIGVQIHHHADLAYAHIGAHKACTGLQMAIAKCDDPHLLALRDQAIELIRAIGRAEMRARERVERLRAADRETWRSAVEGDVPFPDERPGGLIPRCRCHDRCLWHDVLGHGPGDPLPPGTVCNCAVYCYQHERVRGGDES